MKADSVMPVVRLTARESCDINHNDDRLTDV